MSSTDKPRLLVRKSEEDQISRNVLSWLRNCPDIPEQAGPIQFEMLEEDVPCMALSTIQGTYITDTDIIGNYTAEYQYKIIYRAQPRSNGERLDMDETLDTIGDWAVSNISMLTLGDGKTPEKMETSSRAALFGRYSNGDEDHQILMRMTYKVTPRK